MNAVHDRIASNARLVYFMGPSGAGKDSLMHWLAKNPPYGQRLHLARRIVTRPAPDDEATDPGTFERLRASGALALHWNANGWHYGVRREHLQPLFEGGWVLVSGSRAHWPTAQSLYPGLTGVYVHAPAEVLLHRIRARGRESEDEVRARIERAAALPEPKGVVRVCNDGVLGVAGETLRKALVLSA
jgi:ribose 1,5-bisphosphokinase